MGFVTFDSQGRIKEIGSTGAAGASGATGAIGPIGPAIFMSAESGSDGDMGPPGLRGVSGSIISTGAAGAEPASPSSGDLYLPNNGIYAERYSGSIWAKWGPIWQLADPNVQTFAWVNQSTASVDSTNQGIYLKIPSGVASQIHARVKAIPASTYTITAMFISDQTFAGFDVAGICFRDSVSGKLVNLGWVAQGGNGFGLAVSKWSSATLFSADYIQSPASTLWYGPVATNLQLKTPIWFRIQDNGTSRISSISLDGYHFHAIHTVGRTDFLTADQVGFFIGGDSGGAQAQGMWLLNWSET